MLLFKVNDYDGRWAVSQEWTTFTSLLLLYMITRKADLHIRMFSTLHVNWPPGLHTKN